MHINFSKCLTGGIISFFFWIVCFIDFEILKLGNNKKKIRESEIPRSVSSIFQLFATKNKNIYNLKILFLT